MKMRLATLEEIETFNEMYTNFSEVNNGEYKLEPMRKERYEKFVKQESIYFAVLEGKVIGYAMLEAYDDGTAQIKQFFIKEKRKGYGKQFYKLVEEEFIKYNINIIYMMILWYEAECFWKKMGFKSVRGSEEFYKKLN